MTMQSKKSHKKNLHKPVEYISVTSTIDNIEEESKKKYEEM